VNQKNSVKRRATERAEAANTFW